MKINLTYGISVWVGTSPSNDPPLKVCLGDTEHPGLTPEPPGSPSLGNANWTGIPDPDLTVHLPVYWIKYYSGE